MKSISDVMTPDITVVAPNETLQQVAKIMRDKDVGSIPVYEGNRLCGMVTDRDITIRAIAEGKSPAETQVFEVMSGQAKWCFDDQDVEEVLQQMGNDQIRRMPVLNREEKLIGIVSLGDFATRQEAPTNEALEAVSS